MQGNAGSEQAIAGEMLWFIPLAGSGMLDGQPWKSGECWLVEGSATIGVEERMSALLARLP
jgi:mannose-6-phosphate isomerase